MTFFTSSGSFGSTLPSTLDDAPVDGVDDTLEWCPEALEFAFDSQAEGPHPHLRDAAEQEFIAEDLLEGSDLDVIAEAIADTTWNLRRDLASRTLISAPVQDED